MRPVRFQPAYTGAGTGYPADVRRPRALQELRPVDTRPIATYPGNQFGRTVDLLLSPGSRHELRSYPDIDILHMSHVPSGFYDLVVHSDTLEHVPDPVKGLAECRRILRRGGACCFTVPIIVSRLSRTRQGLPPSYHGNPSDPQDDYRVWTEYGADAWRQVLAAGFRECRVVAIHPPAAHALIGIK